MKYHYYGRQSEAVPADPGYNPYPYDETKTEILFDLKKDPGEMQNFIDDSDYADIVTRLRKRWAALGFGPNND